MVIVRRILMNICILQGLRLLAVSSVDMTSEGMKYLSDALKTNKVRKSPSREDVVSHLFHFHQTLSELEINGAQLGVEGIKYLMDGLANNTVQY